MRPLVRFSVDIGERKFTTYVEEGTKLIDALKQLARETGGYVLLKHYEEMNASEIVAIKLGGLYLVKGDMKAVDGADFQGVPDAGAEREALHREQERTLGGLGEGKSEFGIHFWVGKDGIPMAILDGAKGPGLEEKGIAFPNAFELEVRSGMTSFRFGLVDETFNPLNLAQMNERYQGQGGLRLSQGTRDLLFGNDERLLREAARRPLAEKAAAAHGDSRSQAILPDTTVILNMNTGEIFTETEAGQIARGFDEAPLRLQRLMINDLRVRDPSPSSGTLINDATALNAPLWSSDTFDARGGLSFKLALASSAKLSEDEGGSKAISQLKRRGFVSSRERPEELASQAAPRPQEARPASLSASRPRIQVPILPSKGMRMPAPAPARQERGPRRRMEREGLIGASSSRILLVPRASVGNGPLRALFSIRRSSSPAKVRGVPSGTDALPARQKAPPLKDEARTRKMPASVPKADAKAPAASRKRKASARASKAGPRLSPPTRGRKRRRSRTRKTSLPRPSARPKAVKPAPPVPRKRGRVRLISAPLKEGRLGKRIGKPPAKTKREGRKAAPQVAEAPQKRARPRGKTPGKEVRSGPAPTICGRDAAKPRRRKSPVLSLIGVFRKKREERKGTRSSGRARAGSSSGRRRASRTSRRSPQTRS